MNIFFLGICATSLMFFGYFFVECQRDISRRKPHGSSAVETAAEIQVIEPRTDRHFLAHLEKQMADLVTHRQSVVTAEYSKITPAGPVIRP